MEYKIGIYEIYNNNIHGVTNNEGNLLLSFTFTVDEFLLNEFVEILLLMRCFYRNIPNLIQNHSIIRNYKQIIKNPKYYTCNILLLIPGENTIYCIRKTGPLVWFQKKWRKRYLILKKKINLMKNIKNLRKRELIGYYK